MLTLSGTGRLGTTSLRPITASSGPVAAQPQRPAHVSVRSSATVAQPQLVAEDKRPFDQLVSHATAPAATPIAPIWQQPELTAGSDTQACEDALVAAAAACSDALSCAASAVESAVPSSAASFTKDHNSVTIKEDTSVKDAAGAICKVLARQCSVLVSALRKDKGDMILPGHEALNRAVKALAVGSKYVNDREPGHELSFLPFNRVNAREQEQPHLFAFLAFKVTLADGVSLKTFDETELNVSSASDPNSMANAIIRIIKERGQAVMKAGGGNALFVAMSAVINARNRLKRNHDMDIMLVPQWVTEDTRSSLGRESKFLRFNILPCGKHGVQEQPDAAVKPVPPPQQSALNNAMLAAAY